MKTEIKSKNNNIKDYLLGGNENLIGSIISFRKALRKEKFEKIYISDSKKKHYPEGFAVMLYFDHRIGRIVRHLFNPNLIFWGMEPHFLRPIIDDNSTPADEISQTIFRIREKENTVDFKGPYYDLPVSIRVENFKKLNPYQYNFLFLGEKKTYCRVSC